MFCQVALKPVAGRWHRNGRCSEVFILSVSMEESLELDVQDVSLVQPAAHSNSTPIGLGDDDEGRRMPLWYLGSIPRRHLGIVPVMTWLGRRPKPPANPFSHLLFQTSQSSSNYLLHCPAPLLPAAPRDHESSLSHPAVSAR